MLFLLGPILSHLSFPSYGLQLGMFIFASVIIFKTSVLVSWVYNISVFILLFPAFLLFDSPSGPASTTTGIWSEST